MRKGFAMTTVEELQRELESVKVNLDAMIANAAVDNVPEEVEEEDVPWHAC